MTAFALVALASYQFILTARKAFGKMRFHISTQCSFNL